MKLLLVEDEKQLSQSLTQLLEKNKYSVDAVLDGEAGLDYALSGIYDVIVLDIMLPKINGLEVLKNIRKEKISVPVLLLTARGEVSDKVKGLDTGADDYLAKPFDPEELLARLRAVCRRKGEVINDDILNYADFSLNLSTYELEGSFDKMRLAHKEFEILKYLMQRPKRVVTKDDLITKVWGFEAEAEHNNVEVYISFLRKKLVHIGSKAGITTLRGVGYTLEDSVNV